MLYAEHYILRFECCLFRVLLLVFLNPFCFGSVLVVAQLFFVVFVFLVVALGVGTGTGAAPVVLNAARDAGATTVCFATLPFSFEGQQRRAQAGQAVAGILDSADLLVTIPNDKLFESVGGTRVAEAFQKADEVLSAGIGAVYKLVTNPGFINVDIADLRKIIETSGGVSNFGYGESSGKGAAKKAVSLLLKNPLVDGGDVISRARSMLVSIVGGSDLALKDVGDIMDAIKLQAPKDCHISMGTVIEDGRGDSITVAVIASDTRISEVTTATSEDFSLTSRKKAGSQWWQGKRHGKSKELQAKLSLEPSGRGRFKNVEPTILNGEDLDIPTFIRRRIVVER